MSAAATKEDIKKVLDYVDKFHEEYSDYVAQHKREHDTIITDINEGRVDQAASSAKLNLIYDSVQTLASNRRETRNMQFTMVMSLLGTILMAIVTIFVALPKEEKHANEKSLSVPSNSNTDIRRESSLLQTAWGEWSRRN